MFHYWGKADPSYPGTPKWHPLFFVALHDLGKCDVWFQLKAEDALRQAWPSGTQPMRCSNMQR
jgi:hypothetical protein